ncbi:tRNA (guanine(26)-N(2))-dimethyltransferase [Hypsizygus marmoreus]|uniref:tRNA (guanine(26)-N(2))-dimethyltransferase n=1 Tax=Hypsizygus marmoreus TaxID=39966 RepID=A0A369JKI5_HYPMA|nr:tRNA (guanine(26)-N(2))-dimethyltransferase [Hypsizygus marmoreus]
MSTGSTIIVPDGFTLHTENTSHILLSSNEAFLNPVQEFNRDTSIACIRVWSEEMNKAKEARWRQNQEKRAKKMKEGVAKRRKVENGEAQSADEPLNEDQTGSVQPGESNPEGSTSTQTTSPQPYKFVLLEALSATGLRSIRYAKEISLVKYVIANDLSPSATAAMKRNVEINELGPVDEPPSTSAESTLSAGKVRINEGDACTLMYSHRDEKNRVDVVDLDPYGTAAPFIDAAVQCVKDGGLLCVTCTDLSVLATTNYPEKCFSNYGGVPVKAEYCHEAALRLVLHTLSTSASRYGRYIEPLVSLSIDFYVRIFVRVKTAPLEVKKALTKTSTFHICTSCQSFYEQPLGRVIEKTQSAGNVNYLFKIQNGPPVTEKCPECESALHLAGPMWSGPLHDSEFVSKVLEHLEANQDKYGTAVRMKGMLTVAKEELPTPFYFTPAKIASFFHCTTPPLDDLASALLHAGHKISRSHACAGSLKTTATRQDIHSVFRSWIKLNPVKMENVSEKSPARRLLAKEPSFEANFTKHPDSVTPSGKMKLVRYQENPTSHWGPGTKAVSGSKRKRTKDDE